MTDAEILEIQYMTRFFNRLCNLTDDDLMIRKQIEMERQGNLKKINEEMNRRSREL